MALAVARRYARALADIVLAPDSPLAPEQAVGQLLALESLLAESAELRTILLSPAVAPARKRAVVARLAQPLGISPLVRNFLFVVLDRRRINLFREIRRAFQDLLDEQLGVVRAEVISARELTPAQRARLQHALSAFTGKNVRCEFATEEALLGGVVARVGSTVLDGSIRGRLETLRQRLVE